jgi:4-carboxymuconolactone decarboxylase
VRKFILLLSVLASFCYAAQQGSDTVQRYERGFEKLKEIDGKAGENVINALKDIAPDLARYTIEFPFGDIYSRGGLSLRDREIATVAALTAMGNATPQLKVHIKAALNVGLSKQEIVEVITQMAVYSGFPSAINGALAAKEAFAEYDKEHVIAKTSNKERLLEFFKSAKIDEAKMLSFVDKNAQYVAIKEKPSDKCFLYGTYEGHEGFKRLFANLKEAFETQKFEFQGIIEDGDKVMAHGYFEHKVRSTGKLFCSHWSLVAQFREGKIVHCRFFEDTAALEEAFRK